MQVQYNRAMLHAAIVILLDERYGASTVQKIRSCIRENRSWTSMRYTRNGNFRFYNEILEIAKQDPYRALILLNECDKAREAIKEEFSSPTKMTESRAKTTLNFVRKYRHRKSVIKDILTITTGVVPDDAAVKAEMDKRMEEFRSTTLSTMMVKRGDKNRTQIKAMGTDIFNKQLDEELDNLLKKKSKSPLSKEAFDGLLRKYNKN